MENLTNEEKFIEHFILLIKENMDTLTPMSKANDNFESGKTLAYYEVGSMILESAKIFEISLDKFGIYDLDPERLL